MLRPPRFLHSFPDSPVAASHLAAPHPEGAPTGGTEDVLPPRIRLGSEESHHLRKVLRIRPGDEVEVFDPAHGISYFGRVLESAGSQAEIAVDRRETAAKPRHRVHLLVGLINSDRADLIVEKCTEIGIASLTFFSAERSQYAVSPAKSGTRLARWNRLAEAAVKQCYGSSLPEIRLLGSLEQALNQSVPEGTSDVLRVRLSLPAPPGLPSSAQPIEIAEVFLTPRTELDAHSSSLQNLQEMVDSYIIVGPEGGLTGSEESFAADRGFVPCSIGRNVLRTETAAVLACGILQAFLETPR